MVADKADKGKKLKMADKVDEENAEQIDSALVLSIEKLQEVQDELEKINDEASEKILNLEQKYSKLRKPIYSKRDEIVQSIPYFWLTAFLSHPALSDCFTEDDQKILKYLTALEVDDSDDVKSGFSIHFNFKANPYFENTKLSKVYTVLEDGTTKITATPIKWKEGMGISNGVTHEKEGNKRPHEDDSFFTWFVDSEHSEDMEGIADEIAEVIKEDLWPNPLCYFNNDAESEEDVSDAEGDEEFQMHQTLKGGLAGLGQKVRRRDRQNESPAVARPRGILQCSKCGGWGHNARTYGRVPARRMKAEERRAFEAAKAANPTTVNKTKKRVAGISQSQPPMATRRRTNTTAEGQSSSQPTQSATGATRRRANTAVEGQSSSQPGGSATGAAPSRRPNTRSGAAGQRSSTQP